MSIFAAIILLSSLIQSNIARIINFNRFYSITLLILSPYFVLGSQTLIVTIGKIWKKLRFPIKLRVAVRAKNVNLVFLLIAIILSAYFLSQVGFVNRVNNSPIHSYTLDFDRLRTTNESQVKMDILYSAYIPDQDVFSAEWMLKNRVSTENVFADYLSGTHVLFSYGLIPNRLIIPITNTTKPEKDSLVYLGALNVVNGVITTEFGTFNISEIASTLNQYNLIYSNGASEILRPSLQG